MKEIIFRKRKELGMTQQELADKLFISDKVVSKWETGKSVPDITMIPKISKVFNMSCDELLNGIENNSEEPFVYEDKNSINNINKTLSKFKTLILISLGLAFGGFVCSLAITYGFEKSILGFFIMLLFEIAATILTIVAINKVKEIKYEKKISNKEELDKVNKDFGNYSFYSYCFIIASIILSIPFLITEDILYGENMPLDEYLVWLLIISVLIILFIHSKFKDIFITWIIYNKLPEKKVDKISTIKRKMTNIQLLLILISSILILVAPNLMNDPEGMNWGNIIFIVLAFLCLALVLIIFIVFLFKLKKESKKILLVGIRNILFIPFPLILSNFYWMAFGNGGNVNGGMVQVHIWEPVYLFLALVYILLIYLIFDVIEKNIDKKETKN